VIYKGGFQNEKKHGKGVMYFSNGRKMEGVWMEGKLV